MSLLKPTFETDFSPDLAEGTDSAAAIRAGLALPGELRMHGARSTIFIGTVLLSREEEVRTKAADGLARALGGFDQYLGFLSSYGSSPPFPLHPELVRLLDAVAPDQSGRLDGLRTFRGIMGEALEAFRSGTTLPETFYDRQMRSAFVDFLPNMEALQERIATAAAEIRSDLDKHAEEARRRAEDALGRLDQIVRTVRMISLNARVEASRAGEAGKSFGVIAEEVRKLSEQSEAASVEIGDCVSDIMSNFRID